MRIVFTILLTFTFSLVSASTYYVAVNGNDSNPGTYNQPWATWSKAFTSASVQPGDTVFFRGGNYPMTVLNGSGYQITRSGRSDAWIHYMAYPPDFASGNVPVLDCSNVRHSSSSIHNMIGENDRNIGIYGYALTFVHFKGLTVKNLFQRNTSTAPYDRPVYGWLMTDCIAKLENCTVHDVHGAAFRADHWTLGYGVDNSEISYINCDAYNCCDYYTDPSPGTARGGQGTGFSCFTELGSDGVTNINGCRAWNCSDQGYSLGSDSYVFVSNSWSFGNKAYLHGEGHGFKMGWVDNHYDENVRLKVTNCLSAFNDGWGFHTNDQDHPVVGNMNVFNNTAYKNGFWGFHIFNTTASNDAELTRVFRNNLSYGNTLGEIGINTNAIYTHQNNSWDLSVSISGSDFITTDSTGLRGRRKSDGSLPDISFLHLAEGSDLIDKGINTGLPFSGSSPDLGAFEYSDSQIIPVLVSRITVNSAGGSTSIGAIGGTLQLAASVLPADASNKTITWSVTNGTGKATISSSGLLTAVSAGTVTVRATANDGSGVSGTLLVTISDQIVKVSSISVSGASGTNIITTEKGTLQLFASVLPANATNKTLSWLVENGTGKATVNSSGLVTGISGGNVVVRAVANDGSGVTGSLSVFINTAPVIVVNYQSTIYSNFVSELNASPSYDSNKDNLKYEWVVPSNVPVTSKTASSIEFLAPDVTSPGTLEFQIKLSDGKTTQIKTFPVKVMPYRPDLQEAEIESVEASSYQTPYIPSNVHDGNINTMWAVNGSSQWMIVDLKHPFEVEYVQLAFQPGQKVESFFEIEGSTDRVHWFTILDKSSSCGFSGNPQSFELPPSKSGKEIEYIRVICKGNESDTWNYISEVKVFGRRLKYPKYYEDFPVKIFPNPATDFLNIRVDEEGFNMDVMRIVDISGKIIMVNEVDPGQKEYILPLILKKGLYNMEFCSGQIILFAQKLIVK